MGKRVSEANNSHEKEKKKKKKNKYKNRRQEHDVWPSKNLREIEK